MTDTTEFGRGNPYGTDADPAMDALKHWFLCEVLPLEAALMQFLAP